MKLWEKSTQVNKKLKIPVIGNDRMLDIYLQNMIFSAPLLIFWCFNLVGLLSREELDVLLRELKTSTNWP